ncbi:MAG: transglutaminase domain-containing protein [Gammaproteobacteria bacterium]
MTLRSGTVPVPFVRWDLQPPAITYAALVPSPQRIAELASQGFGVVDLLASARVTFAANGEVTEHYTLARLLLDEQAVRDRGNLFVRVDGSREVLTITRAYVLQPDRPPTAVSAATTDVTHDSEDDVFDDGFLVSIPFAGLRPRSISILSWKRTFNVRATKLPWSITYHPRQAVPVERFELQVQWFAGMPRPARASNVGGLRCKETGESGFACSATRLHALEFDDDTTALDQIPQIVVAEPLTWAEVSERAAKILDPPVPDGAALRAVAADLQIDMLPPLGRLAAIHRFVVENIRYVGLEQGDRSVVPHAPDVTLERRYGDCKDKTLLFLALARRAGLEVRPVLTNLKRRARDRLVVPAAHYFDHVIACADVNGSEYCVDLTDPYTPYDVPNGFLAGRIRFDLPSSAPGRFPMTGRLWELQVSTTRSFNAADGSATEREERRYRGTYAAYSRGRLSGLKNADVLSALEEEYKDAVDASAEPKFEVDSLRDSRRPLSIRSRVTQANVLGTDATTRYTDFEPWMVLVARGARSTNRHTNYEFGGISYEAVRVYELPSILHASHLGPGIDFVSRLGSFVRSYARQGRTVRVTTRLDLPPRSIPPGEVAGFNRYLEEIVANSQIWFVIDRDPAPR